MTLYRDERIEGWRDNYVYRLPSGDVVAIYDDLTEQNRAEEDLRASSLRRHWGLLPCPPVGDQIVEALRLVAHSQFEYSVE